MVCAIFLFIYVQYENLTFYGRSLLEYNIISVKSFPFYDSAICTLECFYGKFPIAPFPVEPRHFTEIKTFIFIPRLRFLYMQFCLYHCVLYICCMFVGYKLKHNKKTIYMIYNICYTTDITFGNVMNYGIVWYRAIANEESCSLCLKWKQHWFFKPN